MSATVVLGGIVLALIVGGGVLIWVAGKRSERARGRDKALDVREKQLDAATNAPKTREEVIDRLRTGGGL